MKHLLTILLLMTITASVSAQAITTYSYNPITTYRVYPYTTIPDSYLVDGISLRTCPGEFIATTFIVRSTETLNSFLPIPTDINNGVFSIDSSNIDIKIVKCWYQKGDDMHPESPTMREFLPELLLNDDSLVQVSYISDTEGWNQLKTSTGYHNINNATEGDNYWQVDDSPILLPVQIDANTNKQFWVTIHVPNGTPSGTYSGSIALTEDGISLKEFGLSVEVLPFTLPESPIIVTLYNYLRLDSLTAPRLSQYWGGFNQVQSALVEMKNHGLTNVVIGWGTTNWDSLKELVDMESELNFDMDTVFYWTYSFVDYAHTHYQTEAEVTDRCTQVINFFNTNYGTTANNIYFYPDDEHDLTIAPMPDLIKACTDLGGKTQSAQDSTYAMGALNYDGSNGGELGPLLDMAILAGSDVTYYPVLNGYHQAGLKIGSYGNPQSGEEKPLTFRRNYGLLLWQYNVDYSGTYGLAQGSQGSGPLWNDWYANYQYKMHCFVYPTTNGIVGTIQFEGFREGVNDIRYVTKLEMAIVDARQRGIDTTSAEAYLNSLHSSQLSSLNLDTVRNDIINHIIILEGQSIPGFEFSYLLLALVLLPFIYSKRNQ